MALDREAAKRAGYSDMEINDYLAGKRAQVVPPGELGGARANTSRVIENLKRSLPYATGLIGGAVGGIPGATVGGMVGKIGSQALLKELPKTPAEAIRSVGGEGIEQGALQGIAAVPGALSGLARTGATALRNRAAAKAVERVRALMAAREIGKPLETALTRATAARQAGTAATKQALQAASPQHVTIGDIVEGIVDRQKRLFPRSAPMSTADRSRLVRDVRERIATVMQDVSLGAMKGNKLVYDLEEAQLLKQAFQRNARASYESVLRGVIPKPHLDEAIAGSVQSAIETRAPAVLRTNRATQEAILDVQGLKRLTKAQPRPPVRQIRAGQAENVARVSATLPGPGLLPVSLGPFLRPYPIFRSSALPSALEFAGRAAGAPPVRATATYLPRLIMLLNALRERYPDSTATGQP